VVAPQNTAGEGYIPLTSEPEAEGSAAPCRPELLPRSGGHLGALPIIYGHTDKTALLARCRVRVNFAGEQDRLAGVHPGMPPAVFGVAFDECQHELLIWN
jgi:hypothetical protein